MRFCPALALVFLVAPALAAAKGDSSRKKALPPATLTGTVFGKPFRAREAFAMPSLAAATDRLVRITNYATNCHNLSTSLNAPPGKGGKTVSITVSWQEGASGKANGAFAELDGGRSEAASSGQVTVLKAGAKRGAIRLEDFHGADAAQNQAAGTIDVTVCPAE